MKKLAGKDIYAAIQTELDKTLPREERKKIAKGAGKGTHAFSIKTYDANKDDKLPITSLEKCAHRHLHKASQ